MEPQHHVHQPHLVEHHENVQSIKKEKEYHHHGNHQVTHPPVHQYKPKYPVNRPESHSNPPKYHEQRNKHHHSNPHYIHKRSAGWGYHHTTWNNGWNNHPHNRWDHRNYHHATHHDCSYHQKFKQIKHNLPTIYTNPIQHLLHQGENVKLVDNTEQNKNSWTAGPLTVPPPKSTEISPHDKYDTIIVTDPKNDVVLVHNESLSPEITILQEPFHDSLFNHFGQSFRDIFNTFNLGKDSDDHTKQTNENDKTNNVLEPLITEKIEISTNKPIHIDNEYDDDIRSFYDDQAMDIDVRSEIDIRRKRQPITDQK